MDKLKKKFVAQLVDSALAEDHAFKDITTSALVEDRHRSEARIFVKESTFLSGIDLARQVFKKMDPRAKIDVKYADGKRLRPNSTVLRVKGRTQALLSGERTALNFLAYMSGIATGTAEYVSAVKPGKSQILDTRKTTPNCRVLEKYAVACGGGINHRMSLNDVVMIKDNHREVCQPEVSIADSIKRVRLKTRKTIIVEVDTLEQLSEALLAQPNVILLDNMAPALMKKAVKIRNRLAKKVLLEASGGVSLKRVRTIALTGVERISIGALTHSAPSIDFSMEIMK